MKDVKRLLILKNNFAKEPINHSLSLTKKVLTPSALTCLPKMELWHLEEPKEEIWKDLFWHVEEVL